MKRFLPALLLTATAFASAQQYPTKPIRYIVPFPAGGGADIFARALTPRVLDITGITIIAFIKKGPIGFFKHFIPEGLPIAIVPLIFLIELISFLSRPFSLAIRLAANMVAGHTLIKVIAGFVVPLGLLGALPLAFIVLLNGLEVFVCILQAYVFTLLSSIYLSEALSDHH